jgi:Cache domain
MLKSLKARLFAFEDTLTVCMQIGIATAVLCVGISAALAVSSALVSKARVERLITAEMESFSSSFAENLDLFMHGRYQEIQTLANLEVLRETWVSDPARIRGALESIKGRLPDYSWIGFATPDGVVRVSTGRLFEEASVAALPWFRQGLEKPTTLDVHDASLLAAHVGPNAKGETPRFVDIAVPVRDAGGKVIGVLGAHVNWEWVNKLRERLDAKGGTANVKLTILSSDGIVLLGEGMGRASPSGTLAETNGSPMLTGYAVADGHLDYPGLRWIVLAQKPAKLALIAAQTTAAVILCIGAVLAVIGVGFASLIAGRIARPLQLLTAEADRIGRDPGAQMLPRQRGCLEVLQLKRGAAFAVAPRRHVRADEARGGVAGDGHGREARARPQCHAPAGRYGSPDGHAEPAQLHGFGSGRHGLLSPLCTADRLPDGRHRQLQAD